MHWLHRTLRVPFQDEVLAREFAQKTMLALRLQAIASRLEAIAIRNKEKERNKSCLLLGHVACATQVDRSTRQTQSLAG